MNPDRPLRVLFVDDHRGLLDAFLRAAHRHLDLAPVVASSGSDALDVLATTPIDVLVTDDEMPLLDGLGLMREALVYYPSVARIALSSGSITEALALLPLAHQLVAKPYHPADLIARIRALGRAPRPPSLALMDLVGRVTELPAPSRTFRDIQAVIDGPNPDARLVAEIVMRDPALAARVLQLANSSYFYRGERLSSVGQAVVRLGMRLVRNLALQSGVLKTFEKKALHGFDLDGTVRRSFDAAVLALTLIQGPSAADTATLAALLADLGLLVLALYRGADLAAAHAEAAATGRPPAAVERERFGFDHADVSAHLLTLWGLHEDVVRAVAAHHDAPLPTESGWTVAAVVRVAHHLAARDPIPDAWEENDLLAQALPKLHQAWARQHGVTVD